jgi:hypothetical protein
LPGETGEFPDVARGAALAGGPAVADDGAVADEAALEGQQGLEPIPDSVPIEPVQGEGKEEAP